MAVALHLSRQAERSKRTCRLYIRGQRIDWKRIEAYLRKNKIGAKSLAESESCDVIPSYITFDFADSGVTTPVLATPPTQLRLGPVTTSSHLTPESTHNGSHATTSVSEPTPEFSPYDSSMAGTSHSHDLANESQNAAFGEAAVSSHPAETNQENMPLPLEYDTVGPWAQGELAAPMPEPPTRIVEQFVGQLIATTDPPAVESTDLFDLYKMMSVTPPSTSDSPRQSISPLNHTDSLLYPQYNPTWIDNVSHDDLQVEPDAFQPLGCPAHFLSWSIAACLRKNQGMDHDAEVAIKMASKSFERMVASRHEKCLTSLNLLLALLEAHGKRSIAIELLGKLNVAAMSLQGLLERESVLLTIRFKMDVMCRLKIGRMSDPAVLRDIHYCFERSWGPDSPSTLACLCNLGWRLAGDKDARQCTEALDVLSRARVSLERILGQYDPQTITCLTMLARVLFNLERHVDGLEMMRTAMSRIIVRFPDYHPYRLAALRRFSLFMQKLRIGNAEPILREVASKRLRVLGPDCELTQGSMKELTDFLIEHGRHDKADDASRATTELASRMCWGTTVVELF